MVNNKQNTAITKCLLANFALKKFPFGDLGGRITNKENLSQNCEKGSDYSERQKMSGEWIASYLAMTVCFFACFALNFANFAVKKLKSEN